VNLSSLKKYALPFLAGLAASLAVEPFNLFPLNLLALALLFHLGRKAANAREAAGIGFAFGFGLYGAAISFTYVALHDYGDMPAWLAALAMVVASALLAIYTMLAGYVQARFKVSDGVRLLVLLPALWVLSEWLRGSVLPAFPWMVSGYAQIASPLGGYAPVFGVYGVSLAVAMSAGLLACAALGKRRARLILAALLTLWGTGALLRMVTWTAPYGEPLTVALLQGNIPQEIKFDPAQMTQTLETYRRLIIASEARLIVLPETAFPIMRDELPQAYLQPLSEHARANAGDLIIGSFDHERRLFYNSVFSTGSAMSQTYRKNHLVQFGEYIPLRPVLGWFINEVLHIPMGDLAQGGAYQPPLKVAGQQVAVNICYEDVFGEEIIHALPAATLLVNVTNDAWYGNSWAALQHNQISQMRALETGRMMLRATNNGVTSVIDRDGKVLRKLPPHEEGTLTAEVQGYAGSTPYARFGNAPVLLLLVVMLGYAGWRVRRGE
jgi:apolipoprotein N-acyltransferase